MKWITGMNKGKSKKNVLDLRLKFEAGEDTIPEFGNEPKFLSSQQ